MVPFQGAEINWRTAEIIERSTESFHGGVQTNDKGSIATCTMHIGATYAAQGELREAIQQFKTALMVSRRCEIKCACLCLWYKVQ